MNRYFGVLKKGTSGRLRHLGFEEGMEKTVDWYLENEEWLNNVTSGDYQKYYKEQYVKR